MSESKDYRSIGVDMLYKYVKNKKKSKTIENSIYDYTLDISVERSYPQTFDNPLFRNCYKNKLMNLCLSLNTKSYVKNVSLLDRVKNGNIDLKKIAFMRPQEIAPENWQDLMMKKKAKDELEYTKYAGLITDMYTCGRCKKNKCSYSQRQSKRCDEPMTTYVKCLNCNHNWKF